VVYFVFPALPELRPHPPAKLNFSGVPERSNLTEIREWAIAEEFVSAQVIFRNSAITVIPRPETIWPTRERPHQTFFKSNPSSHHLHTAIKTFSPRLKPIKKVPGSKSVPLCKSPRTHTSFKHNRL